MLHELKPEDYTPRYNYCYWFFEKFGPNVEAMTTTFFSDKTKFYLSGYVMPDLHQSAKHFCLQQLCFRHSTPVYPNCYQHFEMSITMFSTSALFPIVLGSVLIGDRIEPLNVDIVSFPVTMSQKFKFERVTSKIFHANRSSLRTTSDNPVKLVSIV